MPDNTAALDIIQIGALIAIGGALGGLAQSLNRFTYWPHWHVQHKQIEKLIGKHEYKDRFDRELDRIVERGQAKQTDERIEVVFGMKEDIDTPFGMLGKRATIWAVLLGMLIGIAGAFALVGMFSLINVFHEGDDFLNDAYHFTKMFGVSVLGGYIARSSLTDLGSVVKARVTAAEKTVIDAEGRVVQAVREVRQSTEEVRQSTDDIGANKKALHKLIQENEQAHIDFAVEVMKNALLNQDNPQMDRDLWNIAVTRIKDVFGKHKDNRRAAILYARSITERMHGDNTAPDVDGAIMALTEFLASPGRKEKTDEAAVLYNRACYYLDLAKGTTDEGEKEKFIIKSLGDVRRSVELDEGNKKEAAED
jgi:hypothetical protein